MAFILILLYGFFGYFKDFGYIGVVDIKLNL